jgi:uncharacterized protein (TIGR00251 family)
MPASGDSVLFSLRLTPKGGRDAIEGWQTAADGSRQLKARVAAVPEDGKANAALIALLAKSLGLAKSSVSIARGETSRVKTICLIGDAAILKAKLEFFADVP